MYGGFIAAMEWLELPAEWRTALFWSLIISMGVGIARTTSRLDRTEWRKWKQWRRLKPKTALSLIWISATGLCLLAVLFGH